MIDIEYLNLHRWWKDVAFGEPDECWPWLKSCGSHGYGQTWDGVTVRLAHRVAWTLTYGEQIPDQMTIDHECRNRRCCNPAHLRLMSNEENGADNGNKRKTHCKRGHGFTPANTYWDPKGHRRCRTCARELVLMHRKKTLEHKKEMEARALRRDERSERSRKAQIKKQSVKG